MNLVQDLVDSHLLRGRGDEVALWSMGPGGSISSKSCRELVVESNRAAFALRGVGVVPGDRVFIARALDDLTVVALLGVLRNGALAVLGEPDASLSSAEKDGTVVAITDDRFDRASYPSVREVLDSTALQDRMARSRDVFRATDCQWDTPAFAVVDGLHAAPAGADFDRRYFVHPHGLSRGLQDVVDRWLKPNPEATRPLALAPDLATPGALLALFALLACGTPVLVPGRPRDPLSWWQAAQPARPLALVGAPEFLNALPPTASLRQLPYSGTPSPDGAFGSARSLLSAVEGAAFTGFAATARLDGAAVEGYGGGVC